MATEPRLVECPDCGHRWTSEADDPRCSDPDGICGRARAVEVEDTSDRTSSDDVPDDGSRDGAGSGTDDDGGKWSPLFETREERTGAGDGRPDPPSLSKSSDDGDEEDDGSTEISSDEFPELEAEDVRPFLITIFGGPPSSDDDPIPGYFSQQRGEHWALKDHELDQLSRAYARVGNKYLPYLLAEYTVEGLALITTAMIVAPRIQEDRRLAEIEERRQRDTGGALSDRDRRDSTVESEESSDRSESRSERSQTDQLAEGDSEGWQAGARA